MSETETPPPIPPQKEEQPRSWRAKLREQWREAYERLPAWAQLEHAWWLRAIMVAGLAIMGWGAYKLVASVVFAGVAAMTVGLFLWRAHGPTKVAITDKGAEFTTQLDPMRENAAPPPATPGSPPPPPPPVH